MNLRKTVLFVAALNLSYFVIEYYFGRRYNSLSLLSDSVDFLEDASINILIALAIGWSLRKRKSVSYFLALLLLIPGITFIWNAVRQFSDPTTPEGAGMGFVGLGALVVNVSCALMIARHKKEEGGLVMAAFYSARNDAIANVLIIAAGIVTIYQNNIWSDFVVGFFIFAMNLDSAKEIIEASRKEERKPNI